MKLDEVLDIIKLLATKSVKNETEIENQFIYLYTIMSLGG